jgi:hypothetical protein
MDNTIPSTVAKLAQLLSQHIASQPFRLSGTDATSVLELLYITYTETLGRDPDEIDQGFINLGTHLEQLPLDENNAIFAIVCELCNAYEKRAFMDAIKLGAYLITELQEK